MSKNYKYADIPWKELYDNAFLELIYILFVTWFILIVLSIMIPIMIMSRCIYYAHKIFKSLQYGLRFITSSVPHLK